jgi:hypothetical protein
MKPTLQRSSLLLLVLLTSCGQANTANQHLGSMDQSAQEMLEEIRKSQNSLNKATDQLVRMADSLVAFQQMGTDVVKIMSDNFSKKEPTKTDDLDDVLGGNP